MLDCAPRIRYQIFAVTMCSPRSSEIVESMGVDGDPNGISSCREAQELICCHLNDQWHRSNGAQKPCSDNVVNYQARECSFQQRAECTFLCLQAPPYGHSGQARRYRG